jgi:hypothetical protein
MSGYSASSNGSAPDSTTSTKSVEEQRKEDLLKAIEE